MPIFFYFHFWFNFENLEPKFFWLVIIFFCIFMAFANPLPRHSAFAKVGKKQLQSKVLSFISSRSISDNDISKYVQFCSNFEAETLKMADFTPNHLFLYIKTDSRGRQTDTLGNREENHVCGFHDLSYSHNCFLYFSFFVDLSSSFRIVQFVMTATKLALWGRANFEKILFG